MNKYQEQIEKLKAEADEKDSDLAYMGVMGRVAKLKRTGKFEDDILPALNELYCVEMFASNSYRISKEDKTVDFYPPSGSMFIHKTKKWLKGIRGDKNIIDTIKKHL